MGQIVLPKQVSLFLHGRLCILHTNLRMLRKLLSWLTEITVRKKVSIVPSSAQKCIDKLPPPLLLSTPVDNGLVDRKTCPLSLNVFIISSATLSHSPCGLITWVDYHFFSDPGPRNDLLPGGNLLAYIETRSASALHSCSLPSDPHEMSLNIDMQMIRPVNSDGSPILDTNSWTLLMSCSVVDPGKIFHSNSIGSPSIGSKVLHCDELLNQLICSSQTAFDVGLWFIFPKHNTESENT